MRVGSTSGLIDNNGNYWQGDGNLYSAANKVGGPTANYIISSTGWGQNILNTQGNDDALFQYKRVDNPMNYSFDVENGAYTVKLYFAESHSLINDTSNKRRFNILLEGSQVNTTPYSPYELTGGAYRADIQSFDVTVSDGTLNISLVLDASSDDPYACLSGIEIRKRTAL
jgi:hypothetical protein